MNTLFRMICILFLLAGLSACNLPTAATPPLPSLAPSATAQPTQPSAATQPPAAPTAQPEPPTPTLPPVEQPPAAQAAIIIDHECTDLSRIPPEWLERAKQLSLAFAHTSHGSQIVTGLLWLQDQDSRYTAAVRSTWEGLGLPDAPGELRLYDGNNVPEDDYITPELYWSSPEGLDYTRSVAASGWFQFSLWSWCGQQSENDVDTVQQYLAALESLQAEFPQVGFIFITGHTDGNWDGSRLLENNQLVRAYAVENRKILFDFADIESYDPAGTYYPNASDACEWCQDWCDAHPADCANLEQMGDCAHTHPLQCKLKAQAFWWMMARLAGWEGE